MKNLIIILSITAIILVGCENVAKQQSEHVRHIELEGEPNFRDIGGYQTDDGKISDGEFLKHITLQRHLLLNIIQFFKPDVLVKSHKNNFYKMF